MGTPRSLRMSKKDAIHWLKTAKVKHDGWTVAQWVEYYRSRRVEPDELYNEALALWYSSPGFSRKRGHYYDLVELWFPGPHAVENVVDFFGETFDEARSRFTFIRSPHNDIAVLVYTTWKPSSKKANPFKTRENLYDYRLSVLVDDLFVIPPRQVDHRKCYGHTPNCPGVGTGQWELINGFRIGRMSNLMKEVHTRATRAGWLSGQDKEMHGGEAS